MKTLFLKISIVILSLLLGFVCLYGIKSYQTSLPQSGNYSHIIDDLDSEVVLVVLSNCGFCEQAKQYLKKYDVDFVELVLDLNNKEHAFFKQYFKDSYVPILYTRDKKVIGYDEKKYAIMLNIESS